MPVLPSPGPEMVRPTAKDMVPGPAVDAHVGSAPVRAQPARAGVHFATLAMLIRCSSAHRGALALASPTGLASTEAKPCRDALCSPAMCHCSVLWRPGLLGASVPLSPVPMDNGCVHFASSTL